MSEDFEVLSAVLDGDFVEIPHLERALDDPRGRRMFVDFVQLRQVGYGANEDPSPAFYRGEAVKELVKPAAAKRRVPLPLAAAAVLLAMLLGSLIDIDLTGPEQATSVPPEPTRVLRFERGVDWH